MTSIDRVKNLGHALSLSIAGLLLCSADLVTDADLGALQQLSADLNAAIDALDAELDKPEP